MAGGCCRASPIAVERFSDVGRPVQVRSVVQDEHVLIVDDHPLWTNLVEARVAAILASFGRSARCTHRYDLTSALRVAAQERVDVVLLDLALRDSAGLNTIFAMRQAAPEAKIFVFSGEERPARVRAVLRAGADAFIPKTFHHGDLDGAMRETFALGFYAPPSAATMAPQRALTDKDLRVLCLAADGLRDREISARLHIGVNTVEGYMKKLFRIFDVRSRIELLDRARKEGYVD